ncbi:MAG: ATP-binding cassette domain-containing protein [Oscillospiraceae bacterium]|nr:ATP-binding cassette domain-containing protein [Oscillospiraceae bacterium]
MEIYRIENLTFTYPNRDRAALSDVDLVIGRGEFVTLCGPSGCGKTTLLRQLKPSLAPHGVKSGAIFFEGVPLGDLSARDAAAKIGFVLQSPENQIVTDKVWHELAFGLECLGMTTPEIRLRMAETASFFGIQTRFYKPVTELSGGQKQLLALASIMALRPCVLILDEPTSRLDPIAASEFSAAVGKINRELGVTVILTEHRLEEVFPMSDRAVVMDGGRIVADGTPREVGLRLRESGSGMLSAMPTAMRVWAAVSKGTYSAGDVPVTVRDGANWLGRLTICNERSPVDEMPAADLLTAVEIDDIWFKYAVKLPDVIKGLSFKAKYGEITAVLGGNGTGKTTALSLIAGLHTPYRGKVTAGAQVFMLPQDPQSLFVAETVREDLLEILSEREIPKDEKQRRLKAVVKLCRLDGLIDFHPYDLSGGEQQRAALAKVLLLQPKILLLDEPTKGLDAEFKQVFAAILRKLTNAGAAVITASHDVEFCAEYADRCALFFDGYIVAENSPRAFFSGNSFYTTSANRMARGVLPGAVTPGDIILSLGGELPPEPEVSNPDAEYETGPMPETARKNTAVSPQVKKKRTFSKRTVAAAAMILIAVPCTIWAGSYLFGDRKYYFISLLIILETMLPFALVFENRKPQARELAVIAVLCAIAVAGRAAFFMLPQFKPVVALVIIAGVAFGGEAGFLVGAMTGFVSNFFFGQGPWTPYQMFALGIIGFLAGICFRKGLLRRTPLSLAVFGAFATLIVYGGIMNPAQVLIFQSPPEKAMLIAAYLQGIPFDLVHAAATVTFMLIIAKPMLEKLDRVKSKYGLTENDEH